MNVTRLISLFIFLYVMGCQEEETIKRAYPVVTTLETTEINSFGAVFNAEITSGNLTDIVEHGFVWSSAKNNPVTLETADLIKLGKPDNQLISIKINSTLEANKEYLVRSYIQTNDKVIYGKIVTFFSLGSLGPTLLDAIPLEARARDTIMLYGKNFSYRVADNKVKFESLESEVLAATDTSLKVVIPDLINAVQPKVTVDIKSNRSTLNKTFMIKAPEITSLSPANPILCDTIYIRGSNFFPVKQGNRVLLGGVEARITEVISREEIRVVAPYSPDKLETVKLISGGFEVNSVTNLNQVVPEVIGEAVLDNFILT
ncbi:MAG: IPT/TIG domain-containing protein, partial [Cyclobacteriaceae bacterium]|nr:IPT/TIG domain-containing protein [Cyclobacteriaceae bacterium]